MIEASKIRNWEIVGAIFSILAGSLLHFVFEWSGNSEIVALFAAVNESTWEHLKLAFWPTFIFALIEWLIWGRKTKNFCQAVAVKLVSMPFLIIILFYGWLLFFEDSFIWDISIFIISVIIGYILSYRILNTKRNIGYQRLFILMIVIILFAMSFLTYFPPKNLLFEDPVNGGYGIEE